MCYPACYALRLHNSNQQKREDTLVLVCISTLALSLIMPIFSPIRMSGRLTVVPIWRQTCGNVQGLAGTVVYDGSRLQHVRCTNPTKRIACGTRDSTTPPRRRLL